LWPPEAGPSPRSLHAPLSLHPSPRGAGPIACLPELGPMPPEVGSSACLAERGPWANDLRGGGGMTGRAPAPFNRIGSHPPAGARLRSHRGALRLPPAQGLKVRLGREGGHCEHPLGGTDGVLGSKYKGQLVERSGWRRQKGKEKVFRGMLGGTAFKGKVEVNGTGTGKREQKEGRERDPTHAGWGALVYQKGGGSVVGPFARWKGLAL